MKKKFLRVASAAMAGCMMAGLVACTNTTPTDPTTTAGGNDTTTAAPTETSTEEAGPGNAVKYPSINAGEIAVKPAEGGNSGAINHVAYKGEAGKDYTDPAVYTYHDYTAGTSDMKWSTHTWETSDDNALLSYISSGFYNFKLNETKDGWAITLEMAAEYPVDVTADYVGKYDIKEGDTAKAFKIALRNDLCWEDGTKIDADSFIYSYQQLLDPLMKCRRADSLYAGDFEVVGAKKYFYQGTDAFSAIPDTAAAAIASGIAADDLYIDAKNFWNTDSSYTDADGNVAPQYVKITDETVYGESVGDAFSGKGLYDEYFAEGAAYESYGSKYVGTMVSYEANYSWDNVGILKTGDYELTFIVASPMDAPEYYVPYNLSSAYLVYQPYWEACKTYFNANGDKVSADSADIASVTTNVCTNAETTMSFGPYKLTSFELDKKYVLERNDKWYGYSDNNHVGQYQTDIISVEVIAEQATALLAFLKGDIDEVALVSADMAKYGSSDYIHYTPQSYTTKLSFNTDEAKLAERGTTILANMNFRKAFALAIDRTTFAQSYTAAGTAGYGMLNNLYVYDPFTGSTYRDTDAAKDALCKVYGLTYGDDGDFDSLEEAYEAITGYDLTLAKELMQKAYDETVADGKYDGKSNVEIEIRVYNSDDVYVQMFNYLNGALASACEGTGFEGKVTMKMVADSDYYNTNYSGGTDMIFTTWGGANYSPYTLMYECYCDAADGSGQQMEFGFDTTQVKVTINVNGVDVTTDLQTWAKWCDGDVATTITDKNGDALLPFASYDADSRAWFFSRLEYAYLSYFVTTPIYYRNVASLDSQKVNFATDTYVDLVAFGGLEFYTYNYTDEEWAAVASGLTY